MKTIEELLDFFKPDERGFLKLDFVFHLSGEEIIRLIDHLDRLIDYLDRDGI